MGRPQLVAWADVSCQARNRPASRLTAGSQQPAQLTVISRQPSAGLPTNKPVSASLAQAERVEAGSVTHNVVRARLVFAPVAAGPAAGVAVGDLVTRTRG